MLLKQTLSAFQKAEKELCEQVDKELLKEGHWKATSSEGTFEIWVKDGKLEVQYPDETFPYDIVNKVVAAEFLATRPCS